MFFMDLRRKWCNPLSRVIAVLCLIAIISGGCSNDPDVAEIRVFSLGIRHESSTFCPWLTTERDFTVRRGSEVTETERWSRFLIENGIVLKTSLHADARPYGMVERRTYERFREEIVGAAEKAGPVDGVYLDLHGALHVEGYDDAQVDLTRALRRVFGPDVLFSASFDLHGNISEELISELDILTAYRTAPHVDAAETRERAVRLLLESIRSGSRPAIAHVRIPILIPGEKGITSVEPLKSLYAELEEIPKKPGLLDGSIFAAFPWADVPRAGMSVQVVSMNEDALDLARREAERLAMKIWQRRSELEFDVEAMPVDEALTTAMSAAESTVFLTDSGDNTTAGAAGDSTLVLDRLLAHRVSDAVMAGIVDAEAVDACERAGVGAQVRLTIGGRIDHVYSRPLAIKGKVEFLTAPALKDSDRRSAVVIVDGVRVVLLATRRSFISPEDFKDVGIDPLDHRIVVVKLGYLFQALRDIAPRAIMMLTPGFANQQIETLTYRNVQRPMFPLDPEMTWVP